MSALPQTTSPTPAGAAAEWIDLRTASRLCRKSEGQLARRCKDEFASAGHAMKLPPPLGGKSIWHISSVTIRQLQAEPAEPEFDARLLSDAQRLEHGRRARIVAELEAALAATARAGGNVTDAMAAFAEKLAATERDAPSLRTLYRWVDAYRAKGASGLADRRWLSVKRHGQEDDFADFYRELKRLYLDQRRRSKRLCYDLTLHLAEENGWSVPHPRTASRLLAAIPCKTIDLHRNGAREYASTSAPYVERDYTRIVIGGVERDMRSNDVWCADHHQLDVWVALPGGDKPVRPWLCGWMDIRSRKMLGWSSRRAPPTAGRSSPRCATR